MQTFAYDLHLHSCLSPCADEDMTPRNMAGMAHLAELRIVALTDHNSCKNCPAFFAACADFDLVPIAGMELTTAEDIHMVCLFPTLAAAMDFDAVLQEHRMQLPNRSEIFGEQPIYDAEDRVVGADPWFLPAATGLGLNAAVVLVAAHGGICYPAHIDREGNGILAILGGFPKTPSFATAEVKDERQADLAGKRLTLCCSDAHHLWEIGGREQEIALPIERDAAAVDIRKALFEKLLGGRSQES